MEKRGVIPTSLSVSLAVSASLLIGAFLGYTITKHNTPECVIPKQELEIVNPFINIRTCASTVCDKLGEVTQGETYTIVDSWTNGIIFDWYEIEYEEGQYGFIASNKEEPYVVVK